MENIADIDNFRRFKDVAIGQTEHEVRVDLAACYRLIALYGMTDLAANHVTARVPGTTDQFFINPYGMLYDEITASSLIKIDLHGNILQQGSNPNYGVNVAGYVIHSAIHAARHDVQCIIHTHTRSGVAVACMNEGLLPIHQNAMLVSDNIATHDYEGPITSDGERVRLVHDLGQKQCLLLHNHGLLTCGRSIAEAFVLMYRLDTACKIQVDLMRSGAQLKWPSRESQQAMSQLMQNVSGVTHGNLEWPSLKRRLDRLLPGYDE